MGFTQHFSNFIKGSSKNDPRDFTYKLGKVYSDFKSENFMVLDKKDRIKNQDLKKYKENIC